MCESQFPGGHQHAIMVIGPQGRQKADRDSGAQLRDVNFNLEATKTHESFRMEEGQGVCSDLER